MSGHADRYRGVILAGGSGTRLRPLTLGVNKHLLPVGNEPMIYHGFRKIAQTGIKHITVVTRSQDAGAFAEALEPLALSLDVEFVVRCQHAPLGLVHALRRAERIGDDRNLLVLLGDQIFDDSLDPIVMRSAELAAILRVSAHGVVAIKSLSDPRACGVIEFGPGGMILGVEEKPERPKSNWAALGIYAYGPKLFEFLKKFAATDSLSVVNNQLAQTRQLSSIQFDKAWLDAGTLADWRRADDSLKSAFKDTAFDVPCLPT